MYITIDLLIVDMNANKRAKVDTTINMGAGSSVSLALILCKMSLRKLGHKWLVSVGHNLRTKHDTGCATELGLIRGSQDDYPHNINYTNAYLYRYHYTHLYISNYYWSNTIHSCYVTVANIANMSRSTNGCSGTYNSLYDNTPSNNMSVVSKADNS